MQPLILVAAEISLSLLLAAFYLFNVLHNSILVWSAFEQVAKERTKERTSSLVRKRLTSGSPAATDTAMSVFRVSVRVREGHIL